MTNNKKSSDKTQNGLSSNKITNFKERKDNFINPNEKVEQERNNTGNNLELPKQKKRRLSLVFDIGEKSPFKFNDKVLDPFKYISPTITPDNLKSTIGKKNVNFTNNPLISPIEEGQLIVSSKTKNGNLKSPNDRDKNKNSKNKKNDSVKKKGKGRYNELQFKTEAKQLVEISQIEELNKTTPLSNHKFKDTNKINNIKSENDNKVFKASENEEHSMFIENVQPLDLNVQDDKIVESDAIPIQKASNVTPNKPHDIHNHSFYPQKKNNPITELSNIEEWSEPELLSADLFKDTDDDILLSSRLSQTSNINNEENVKLINNFDENEIVISSVTSQNDVKKDIDISDLSTSLGSKEDIEFGFSNKSEIVLEEDDKLSSSNFRTNFNFDDYNHQMLIDNSQNDELSFSDSQLNPIDDHINDNGELLLLNDEDPVTSNELETKNINEILLSGITKEEPSDMKMSSDEKLINKVDNDVNLQNKMSSPLKETKNETENQVTLEQKDNITIEKPLILDSEVTDNNAFPVETDDKLKEKSKNTTEEINDKEKTLINYLDENEKIAEFVGSSNKDQTSSSIYSKILNDMDINTSDLIPKSSSNLSFIETNTNSKNYTLKINRLKSVLIPNKNHKNKEPVIECNCHGLHLNRAVRKVIVGKYAIDNSKNWLIMETKNSIEIWKYNVELNDPNSPDFCYWTKFSERAKNFCEEIHEIQISPTNEYIVIIGSNYSNKPRKSYYRCGLIIDIYTLNEIYLDIKINDSNIITPNIGPERTNDFSKICYPLNEYLNETSEKDYNKLFIPGYKNGQLIEFNIKKNLR